MNYTDMATEDLISEKYRVKYLIKESDKRGRLRNLNEKRQCAELRKRIKMIDKELSRRIFQLPMWI